MFNGRMVITSAERLVGWTTVPAIRQLNVSPNNRLNIQMHGYAQLLPSYDFIEKFEIYFFLTSVLLTKTTWDDDESELLKSQFNNRICVCVAINNWKISRLSYYSSNLYIKRRFDRSAGWTASTAFSKSFDCKFNALIRCRPVWAERSLFARTWLSSRETSNGWCAQILSPFIPN